MDAPPIAAVLLAAGESSRMGHPKQLLMWRGMPLIQYQVRQLLAAGVHEAGVGIGHRASEMRALVEQMGQPERVHVALNRRYRQGKTTSIKAGLRALRQPPRAVMVLAVDQPRPAAVLKRLVEAHLAAGHLISIPSHAGRHGPPPLFDGSLIPELLRISEERQGVREVIERHRDALRDVPMDTRLVLTNLNTEEDYQRALELFGSGAGASFIEI